MYSLLLHGKRFIELEKWRNLRVTVNLLQNVSAFTNPYSSASAAVLSSQDNRTGKLFTVSYLVDSLGLTSKLAESISKKVSFEGKGNPDSVLELLRNYGFTDSQISRIIGTCPQLLIEDAETSLGPKLQVLQSIGASSSEVIEIVSKVPKILGKNGSKSITLYYDLVRGIFHEEEIDKNSKYEKLCNSLPQGKQDNKIRNVSMLRELGVPQQYLIDLLISKWQPVCGKEKFEESLKKVVEMGFNPTTSRFVKALHVVYEISDKTMEEKFDVYKSLGFTEDDIWKIFKKWPFSMKFSEKKILQTFETLKRCGLLEDEVLSALKKYPQFIRTSEEKIEGAIETYLDLGFSRDEFTLILKRFPQSIVLTAETVKKKIEFLVKKMNWPLKAVVVIPSALGCSLEKRIMPRCYIIKALMSKGLLRDGNGMPSMTVLLSTDQAFLNRFVMKHDKLVPELMAIFNGNHVL